MVVTRPGFGSAEDETLFQLDLPFLEGAVVIGYRKAAELLLHRLANTGLRLSHSEPAT